MKTGRFWIMVAFLVCALAGLTACGGNNAEGSGASNTQTLEKPGLTPLATDIQPAAGVFNVDLTAGQNINTGRVFVWVDNTGTSPVLYVQYDVVWPMMLTETRLAVAYDPAEFPVTKSNHPKIGHFPYGTVHVPKVNETTYMIPIPSLPTSENPIYIAAHAVVNLGPNRGCETAWGGAGICGYGPYGNPFSENGWGTYFAYYGPDEPIILAQ